MGTSIEPVTPAPHEKMAGLAGDREFAAVRAGCQASGGVVRGGDLAGWLEKRQRGDAVSLAKLIISGNIFGFEWQGNFWIPMFQFDFRDLSIRQAPRKVRAELGGVFDGWTLSVWFVQPCVWLNGQSPIDLLEADLPAVLEAARSERFVATGWAGKPGASFAMAPQARGHLAPESAASAEAAFLAAGDASAPRCQESAGVARADPAVPGARFSEPS
jgi:hypothetical protein